MSHSTTELSLRERQVLQLAAEGLTNDAIAEVIGVAPSSVESYFYRVYQKLNIRPQRDEAVWRFMTGGRYAAE